jgi:hypothetical protein
LTARLSRLQLALKSLTQLGLAPICLYGLYRLGLASGHYRRLDASMLREATRAARPSRPAFPLPDPAAFAQVLSRSARSSLLSQANLIARGKYRPFGGSPVSLQLTFKRPLQHWTAYETGKASLASFGLPHDDIKFAWEPARFGWAFLLGRAYHVSRDERHARLFWRLFESFDRGNPPYNGPHWMNGQEVAIRLMALIWSAQVFAPARLSTPRRVARLTHSIAQHAARIPPTLVYARSQNNNHLVIESASLFLAGCALDHQPWRDLGWRWLNRAIQRQIGPSGEYIQHSTNYHRLMLQAALLVDAARHGRGDLWPLRTQRALARAAHWLFSLLDGTSGRVPNLGANDGALLLPLSSASFDDFRPTVQAAARAFLRTGLESGDWDELSLWLGLAPAGHAADSDAYAAEHLRSTHSWACLQASTFKTRLSHMDQLHVDLWWRGLNVAADAGTYLYNAAPPWDNSLVSSRVHNCVTIDGREQMTRAGRFMVVDWFPAYSRRVLSADPSVLSQVSAFHAGYDRIGIRHERTLRLLEAAHWQVKDELRFLRPQPHSLRLHWLLLDGECRLQQRGHETRLRLRVPGGWIRVTISSAGFEDQPPRLSLIRAGKVLQGQEPAQPFEGWISPSYGQKLPALSLSLTAQASHTCSFTTEFVLPD